VRVDIEPGTKWATEHFEVSTRTIERDIAALQQAGVPIWATSGPGGGYSLDPQTTLPPLNFSPSEAAAIALALAASGSIPFGDAARAALRKVTAAMSAASREGAHALLDHRVVRVDYQDKHGDVTCGRLVEPLGFVDVDRGLPPGCRRAQIAIDN
jgi:predicted DNA-binding transcriptional regulator YafY